VKSRVGAILKLLLFFGLAAFLFGLAFQKTDPAKLWNDLSTAKMEYVALSALCGYLAFVSRGLRWNILLEPLGYAPKKWNAIHAVTIGYLANLAVPRAGEVARCTSLYQSEKIPVPTLIGTVILERLIDLIMMALLFVLTLALQFDTLTTFLGNAQGGSFQLPGWVWPAVIALIGILIWGLLQLKRWEHLGPVGRLLHFLRQIKSGLKTIFQIRAKAAFVFHTVFIWLMYYLMIYVVFFSFPFTEQLDPTVGLFLMIVGGLGILVPVPGGIGAYHYLVVLAMGLLAIPANDAMSFATLVHSTQTLMTIFTGVLAVIFLYFERRKTASREPRL
jgi:uncharacterized membrane protein YbhN (UPF0104 family)